MTPSVELSWDSIDALLRHWGLNAMDRLYEVIQKELPNTVFVCRAIWVHEDNALRASLGASRRVRRQLKELPMPDQFLTEQEENQ